MSIEVRLSGGGAFDGAASSIFDYSVTEESMPISIADSTGGIGQVSFTAVDDTSRFGSNLLLGSELILEDDMRGTTVGIIGNLSGSEGTVTVSGDSKISRLVARRNAEAVNGTFSTAINYYLGLAGVTSGVTVDPALANISVVAPGWIDQDVFTKVKELCALHGADIALVGSTISVRPIRAVEATPITGNLTWSAVNSDLQYSFEMLYYNNSAVTNYLVEPEGGWTPEARVLQVDAGETVTENLPVNMWVTSVQQPAVQNAVDRYYTASSVYSIVGNDGFPIPAAQWTAHGGRMSFAINENRMSIDVTLTGVRPETASAKYAPFRVAVSSGTEYYSTLRIVASGIYQKEDRVLIYTGVSPTVGTENGTTVGSTFVGTRNQAYQKGMVVARQFGSAMRTVSFTENVFKTSNPVTQTFGFVAGSRVRWRRGIYRVRSANITQSTVEYTAEADTTFNDFQASASGMTFNDFQASFSGVTFDEFGQIPLPVVKEEYDNR